MKREIWDNELGNVSWIKALRKKKEGEENREWRLSSAGV